MFSDLERKIRAFPGPTGCRAKVPKSVVRGRRSQEIAVTARACGPNAPGLTPWVHGGEARRPPDGRTVQATLRRVEPSLGGKNPHFAKKVRALPASRDYYCVAQRSEPDWNVGLLPNHHGMQE